MEKMFRMRTSEEIKQNIITQLATVIDPELGVDIVNLGLVYEIDLDEDGICLIMKVPEVKNVDVEFVWYPVWSPEKMSDQAKKHFGYDEK